MVAQAKTIDERTMLETVLMFSELVQVAQQSYKHGLGPERREVATKAFLELVLDDGNIAKVGAKEGFQALLKSPVAPFGSPNGNRTRVTTLKAWCPSH